MSERFLSRLRLACDVDAGLHLAGPNATDGRIESLPVGLAKVNAVPWVLSYHIRNVPVLSANYRRPRKRQSRNSVPS